jgi:GNAT superfamily N-acetyltransferase
MAGRAASPSDAAFITSVITAAFLDDPVWGLALRRSDGRPLDLDRYWRLFVDGAVRFGTARLLEDGSAVSIWLPPGAAELSDQQLTLLEELITRDLDGTALDALHLLYERFEESRAGRPAHSYLSLLATHPEHRGKGVGQQLLAADLALWDSQGVPAYLESTNAGNNHRYARAGFVEDGGFAAVRDDTWITAMWRPVGGTGSG